jgi:uncharacterized protein (TIRG00374 family)
MKRVLQILVSLILLGVVVAHLEMKALADAFGRLRIPTITMAIALFFLSCGLAASKWRLLWRRATWWQMLTANFAAQFYSLILPGQLAGEVVKTLRVGHQFSDTTNVAASVLVDRATGLVGLLILAFCGALLSSSALATSARLVLGLAVVGVLGMLYAITLPWVFRTTCSVIERIADHYRWLRPVSRKMIGFFSAWASLMSKPATTLAAICLGIAYQVICVAVNFAIASDIGIDISYADWCWIFGLVSIALLLPITIAGVGVREGTYAGLLALYGVSIEKAVAVSTLVFGISLLGALAGAIECAYAMRPQQRLPR